MNRADQTNAKLYECCVCHRVEPWDSLKGWRWWGSLDDMDTGRVGPITCSDACRAQRKETR